MLNFFKKYKFRRTYICGSKQKEFRAFELTLGVSDDLSDCDWLTYKDMLETCSKDTLHVITSWKDISIKIGFALLIIGILIKPLSPDNLIIPIILSILSLIFIIIHFVYRRKEVNEIISYSIAKMGVDSGIEKTYNIHLNK